MVLALVIFTAVVITGAMLATISSESKALASSPARSRARLALCLRHRRCRC